MFSSGSRVHAFPLKRASGVLQGCKETLMGERW